MINFLIDILVFITPLSWPSLEADHLTFEGEGMEDLVRPLKTKATDLNTS